MKKNIRKLKGYRDVLVEGTLDFKSLSSLEMQCGICWFVLERIKNPDKILNMITNKRDRGGMYLCTPPRDNEFAGRPLYEGQEERIAELDRIIKLLEDNERAD